MGEYKVTRYTANDIDYFIGCDLETEDLYIVPISTIENVKSSISINQCSE